jgi:hypothetical protein
MTSAPDFFEPTAERQCQHCGQPFIPRQRSGGSPQKFCSTECRRQARKDQRAASAASAHARNAAIGNRTATRRGRRAYDLPRGFRRFPLEQ